MPKVTFQSKENAPLEEFQGDSAITIVAREKVEGNSSVKIAYQFLDRSHAVAIITTFLMFVYSQPDQFGVVNDAIQRFFVDAGMIDTDGLVNLDPKQKPMGKPKLKA